MRITNLPPSAPQAASAADIEADFWRELREIEAESMGWTQLAEGCYLHAGGSDDNIIEIVGVPHPNMAGTHVLWLF
jgi:hypothetical protein